MNWKELKEFANSLDEKLLEKEVILWIENEAVNNIEAMHLEADYYIGEEEEGCYPLSDVGLTIEDIKPNGLEKVYEKGDPILW